MSGIKEACQGKWVGLLKNYGVPDSIFNGKHQPCPLCPGSGGKDRFRFDDKQGNGTYYCSQCGAGDGVSFLMKYKGFEFKRCVEELEKVVGKVERKLTEVKRDDFKTKHWMQQIWSSGREVDLYSPVGKYLESRGIVPAAYPTTIRYVEKCLYEKGIYRPAMVAIFQGPDGIAGQMHRTFLTYDGRKADVETVRKTMPLPFPHGGAVRLGGVGPVLGIAEGIESAMAASIQFGFPVWAALSKVMLMKFIPPDGTEELFIFSDNDGNYAGQAHAYGLAAKLSPKHPEMLVQVCVPPKIGTDWNDELTGKQNKITASA